MEDLRHGTNTNSKKRLEQQQRMPSRFWIKKSDLDSLQKTSISIGGEPPQRINSDTPSLIFPTASKRRSRKQMTKQHKAVVLKQEAIPPSINLKSTMIPHKPSVNKRLIKKHPFRSSPRATKVPVTFLTEEKPVNNSSSNENILKNSQRPKKKLEAKDPAQDVRTVNDAIMYFIDRKNKHDVLYFQHRNSSTTTATTNNHHRNQEQQQPRAANKFTTVSHPYDLARVGHQSLSSRSEHYMMSSSAVVRTTPYYNSSTGSETERVLLSDFVQQSRMFDHILRGVPFFAKFMARKVFYQWSRKTSDGIYRRVRQKLMRNLLISRESFVDGILKVNSVCQEVKSLKAITLSSTRTHASTIEVLRNSQNTCLARLEDNLIRLQSNLSAIYDETLDSIHELTAQVYLMEELYESDVRSLHIINPKIRSTPISVLREKKSDIDHTQARAVHDLSLMERCNLLFRYMFLESSYFLVVSSASSMEHELEQCNKILNVSAVFEKDRTVVKPSEDDVKHFFVEIVFQVSKVSSEVCSLLPNGSTVATCDNGLRELQRILATDKCLKKTLGNLYFQINKTYLEVNEHAMSFDALRDIYESMGEEEEERILLPEGVDVETSMTILEKTKALLAKYSTWQATCQKIQSSYHVSFIEVHCHHVIVALLEAIEKRRNTIFSVAKDLILRCTRQLLVKMRAEILVLDERPQSVESFCYQAKVASEISTEQQRTLQSEVRVVEDIFRTLKRYSEKSSKEVIVQYNLMHSTYAKHDVSVEAQKSYFQKMHHEIGTQVTRIYKQHSIRCEVLHSTLKEKIFSVPSTNTIELRIKRLKEIRADLDSNYKLMDEYRSYQNLLGLKASPMESYEQCLAYYQLVRSLWDLADKWNKFSNEYESRSFRDQAWQTLQKRASELLGTIQDLNQKLVTELGTTLQEKIGSSVTEFKILTQLGGNYMHDDHWKLIFKAMEVTQPISGFTLLTLRKYSYRKYFEAIQSICERARLEGEIAFELQQMKEKWNRTSISVVPFAGTYKVDDTCFRDIRIQVDEDSLKNQALIHRVTADGAFNDLVEWGEELRYAEETLDIWNQCQSKHAKMQAIFQLDDIIKHSVQAVAEFDLFNRKWTSMMLGVSTTQSLLYCLKQVSNKEFFSQGLELLERLTVPLASYLSVKRSMFPRFNLISDGELFDILGAKATSAKFPEIINKCYSNVQRVICYPVKTSGNKDKKAVAIHSFYGTQEEKMELESSILVSNHPEVWMKEFGTIVSTTMQQQLQELMEFQSYSKFFSKSALEAISKGLVFDFFGEKCAQILGLAINILVVNSFKSVITEVELTWTKIRERLQLLVECLVKGHAAQKNETQSSTSSRRINGYKTLVLCAINLRYFAAELERFNIQDLCDYRWQRIVRHYWDPSKNRAVVEHGYATYTYGMQYLNSKGLVVSPLTERVFFAITTALRLNTGGILFGPTGCGKHAMVNEMASYLGLECVNYNCAVDVEPKNYARMLIGMISCDIWLCLSGLDNAKKELLSFIGTQISDIQNAIRSKMDTLSIGETEVQLKPPPYGFFVSSSLEEISHCNFDFQKSLNKCLPMACVSPSSVVVIEALLTLGNFRQSEKLAKMIQSFSEMVECEENLSPGFRLSVREARVIVEHAIANKDSGMFSLEEQNVAFATWQSIGSRVEPNNKRMLSRMISMAFPKFKSSALQVGFLRVSDKVSKYTKAYNLENIPTLSHRTAELVRLISSNPINIVVGAEATGKSTLINIAATISSGQDIANHIPVQFLKVNSAVLRTSSFYGNYSESQKKWINGFVPQAIHDVSSRKNTPSVIPWIVFDGIMINACVEPLYLLSDSNTLLAFPNGDRIDVGKLRILFETTSLSTWSPTAISRFGVVYLQTDGLQHSALLKCWIRKCKDLFSDKKEAINHCASLVRDHFSNLLAVVKKTAYAGCFSSCNTMRNLLSIIELYLEKLCASTSKLSDCKLLFIFAATWSIGAPLRNNDRKVFHEAIVDAFPNLNNHPIFQSGKLIYDVYFSVVNGVVRMSTWKMKVQKPQWNFNDWHQSYLYVQSESSVCYDNILYSLAQTRQSVLLVGKRGCGKTRCAKTWMKSLHEEGSDCVKYGMSSFSSLNSMRKKLFSRLERKSRWQAGPSSGRKHLAFFIDDLNLISNNLNGTAALDEQLRQLIDSKTILDGNSLDLINVKGVKVASSYTPVSVGRLDLPLRLRQHFHIIHMGLEDELQLRHMFRNLGSSFVQSEKLLHYNRNLLRADVESVIEYALSMFNIIRLKFKPKSSEPMAFFTLGDLCQVFEGIFTSRSTNFDTKTELELLSVNLSFGTYRQRLFCPTNKHKFDSLHLKLVSSLNYSSEAIDFVKEGPELYLYSDFGNQSSGTGYHRITEDQVGEIFRSGVERLHSRRLSGVANVSESKVLTDFESSQHNVIFTRRVFQQEARPNLIIFGNHGVGKRTVANLAASSLQFKFLELGKCLSKEDIELLKSHILDAGIRKFPCIFFLSLQRIDTESLRYFLGILEEPGSSTNHLFTAQEEDKILLEMSYLSTDSANILRGEAMRQFMVNVQKHIRIVLSVVEPEILQRVTLLYPSILHNFSVIRISAWHQDSLEYIYYEKVSKWKISLDEATHMSIAAIMIHVIYSTQEFDQKFRTGARILPTQTLKVMISKFKELYGRATKNYEVQQEKLFGSIFRIERDIKSINRNVSKETELSHYLERASDKVKEALYKLQREKKRFEVLKKSVDEDQEAYDRLNKEIEHEQLSILVDLDRPIPAIMEANSIVSMVQKRLFSSIQHFTNPPARLKLVMKAICIFFRVPTSWKDAQGIFADRRFTERLTNFDKETINIKNVGQLISITKGNAFGTDPTAHPLSSATVALCIWVKAMVDYAIVKRDVAPMQASVAQLKKDLCQAQACINITREKLRHCANEIKFLEGQCQKFEQNEEKVALECAEMEDRRSQVTQVYSELTKALENLRSQQLKLDQKFQVSLGSAVLLAAVFALLGPRAPDVRTPLVSSWESKFEMMSLAFKPLRETLKLWLPDDIMQQLSSRGVPHQDTNLLCSIWILTETLRESKLRRIALPYLVDPHGVAIPYLQRSFNTETLDAEEEKFLSLFRKSKDSEQNVVVVTNLGLNNRDLLSSTIQESFDAIANVIITSTFEPNFSKCQEAKGLQVINFELTPSGVESKISQIYCAVAMPLLQEQITNSSNMLINKRQHCEQRQEELKLVLCTREVNILDDIESFHAFVSINQALEAAIEEEADARWAWIRKSSELEEFRIIGISIASTFEAARRLQSLQPSLKYLYSRLFAMWTCFIEMYVKAQTKEEEDDDVDDLAKDLMKEFIKTICIGIPQNMHLVLAYYSVVLSAQRSDRISTEIATSCLSPSLLSDNSHSNYFRRVSQYFVGTIIKQTLVRMTTNTYGFTIQKILSRRQNRSASVAGKRHDAKILDLISRIPHFDEFEDIIEDMGTNPETWISYANSAVVSLSDISVADDLDILEKLVLCVATHGRLTIEMVQDVLMEELGTKSFTSNDLKGTLINVQPNIPILILHPQGKSLPIRAIRNAASETGIPLANVLEVSLSGTKVSLKDSLRLVSEAIEQVKWIILTDLDKCKDVQELRSLIVSLADCNLKFRLWIIGNLEERSSAQHQILQHSFQFYLQSPSSISQFVETAVANPQVLQLCRSDRTYSDAYSSLLLYNALLRERLEYGAEGSGWCLPYQFGLEYLRRGTELLDQCVEYELTASQMIPLLCEYCDCVYTMRVSNYNELSLLQSVLRNCFEASWRNHQSSMTSSILKLKASVTEVLCYGKRENLISQLPEISTTELGIASSAMSHRESAFQTLFTSFIQKLSAQDRLIFSRKTVLTLLRNLKQRVPEQNCFKHDARNLLYVEQLYNKSCSIASLLSRVMLQEVVRMESYLSFIHNQIDIHITNIRETVVRVDEQERHYQLYYNLIRSFVPSSWRHSHEYTIPTSIEGWVSWMLSSVTFLQRWIKRRMQTPILIPSLAQPSTIFRVLCESYCKKLNISAANVGLKAMGHDSIIDQDVEEFVILVSGLSIRNMFWDSNAGVLKDLEDTDDLYQPISCLWLVPYQLDEVSTEQYYHCPVYKELSWETQTLKKNLVGYISLQTTCSTVTSSSGVLIVCSRR